MKAIALALVMTACATPPPAPPVVSNSVPFDGSKSENCSAACGKHVPLRARVIKVEVTSGGTLITFGAGNETGVDRHAIVRVVGHPDADVILIRVDKRTSVARTQLQLNDLGANPSVEITLAP